MKTKRDSKDPLPSADNSMRVPPDGSSPTDGGEKKGQKKAERVKGDQRFTLRTGGETQPARNGGGRKDPHGVDQTGGNIPATQAVESHNQGKAQYVKANQRGF